MKTSFWKMHGAGNDFIILQARTASAPSPAASQIQAWCQRHTGIGADGLLLLRPPTDPRHHFRMQFFNPDGNEADMCGNGARCIARYAHDQNLAPAEMIFETASGTVAASVQDDAVRLQMPLPRNIRLKQELILHNQTITVDFADTGVPHVVVTCPDLAAINLQTIGTEIRYHPRYAPHGTNVDWIQVVDDRTLHIRTYERGVEGETRACGTGVTAAAVVALLQGKVQSPVRIQTAGGDWLTISATFTHETFHRLELSGPAAYVFEGVLPNAVWNPSPTGATC